MEAKNVLARYFSVSIVLSELEESQRRAQGHLVQGAQHFVEAEGFDARKTASLVAFRHNAKSLSFIVAYLNAEIAEAQREFPKDPVVVLVRRDAS